MSYPEVEPAFITSIKNTSPHNDMNHLELANALETAANAHFKKIQLLTPIRSYYDTSHHRIQSNNIPTVAEMNQEKLIIDVVTLFIPDFFRFRGSMGNGIFTIKWLYLSKLNPEKIVSYMGLILDIKNKVRTTKTRCFSNRLDEISYDEKIQTDTLNYLLWELALTFSIPKIKKISKKTMESIYSSIYSEEELKLFSYYVKVINGTKTTSTLDPELDEMLASWREKKPAVATAAPICIGLGSGQTRLPTGNSSSTVNLPPPVPPRARNSAGLNPVATTIASPQRVAPPVAPKPIIRPNPPLF